MFEYLIRVTVKNIVNETPSLTSGATIRYHKEILKMIVYLEKKTVKNVHQFGP